MRTDLKQLDFNSIVFATFKSAYLQSNIQQ